MCVSVIAALNNMAFGYDVGVISGSLIDMASSLDLSVFAQEMATSGLNFVSGLGALGGAGMFMDTFGRRATLLVSSLLLLLGGTAVTFAHNFDVLLFGRALQGLGSGCAWCACAVYIAEMAPKEWRGGLVAISDISINVGILLGFALDRTINLSFPHDADLRWRVAMGVSLLLPLIYLVAYPFLPESPRWLLMRGRKAEADRVLAWLEGPGKQHEVNGVAIGASDSTSAIPDVEISAAHEGSQGCRESTSQQGATGRDAQGVAPDGTRPPSSTRAIVGDPPVWASSGGTDAEGRVEGAHVPHLRTTRNLSTGHAVFTWRDSLLPPTNFERRQVLVALGLGLAQQLTGTEAILYYTPRILNQCVDPEERAAVGISQEEVENCVSVDVVFLVSLGVGVSKLIGEFVAAAVVDTVGRRRTMVFSNLALSIFVLCIALRFPLGWPLAASATSLCFAMLFFSLGPGALTFVVVSEMLPLYMRAKVVAMSVFFNRLCSGTIALTFLSLNEAIGPFAAFGLYAGLGILITIFYGACVVETTGKSLEEAAAGEPSLLGEGAEAQRAVRENTSSGVACV